MLSTIKTLRDLLSEEEYTEYCSTEHPFNIPILHRALKAKLAEEPDYEVWVPLTYYKCKQYIKNEGPLTIQPPRTLISSKGAILSLKKQRPPSVLSRVLMNGYYYTPITRKRRQVNVVVHRALASVFIPVGELLKAYHPSELQVNHIDGDKLNIKLDNLEWATPLGNVRHAIESGLMPTRPSGADHPSSKPVKGTFLKGPHKGYEFVIFGPKHAKELGFDRVSIWMVCVGRQKLHAKCTWAYATEEEVAILPRHLP